MHVVRNEQRVVGDDLGRRERVGKRNRAVDGGREHDDVHALGHADDRGPDGDGQSSGRGRTVHLHRVADDGVRTGRRQSVAGERHGIGADLHMDRFDLDLVDHDHLWREQHRQRSGSNFDRRQHGDNDTLGHRDRRGTYRDGESGSRGTTLHIHRVAADRVGARRRWIVAIQRDGVRADLHVERIDIDVMDHHHERIERHRKRADEIHGFGQYLDLAAVRVADGRRANGNGHARRRGAYSHRHGLQSVGRLPDAYLCRRDTNGAHERGDAVPERRLLEREERHRGFRDRSGPVERFRARSQRDPTMNRSSRLRWLATGCALVWLAAPLQAQQPLQDVLSFLLTNQAVPTGDFVKDALSAATTRDTITRLLSIELTTLPLSSSSAGFTYRFNPALGTVERSSSGFGPFFTERSLTAGQNQASIGLTLQEARYTSLDSHNLRDGTFLTTANQFRDEPLPFDVETLTLRIESRTATMFANYGITNSLDVGVAIPLVWVSLDGSRINVYRGARLLQASAVGTATGLADIAVRSKLRLVEENGAALAVVGEVRLPTGRKEDLLGEGETSVRGLVTGSLEAGRLAIDVNAGLKGGGLSRELDYRGAASVSALPRLTLIGEVLGRRIADLGEITQSRAPHPTIAGVDTIRLVTTNGDSNTLVAVGGFKWNVGGTWLLSANASVPLTDRGLRAPVIVRAGIDYAFGE